MTPSDYDHFTEELHTRLASDERVIAFVALGSMAEVALRDEYSDHDFWVVVRPDARAGFLVNLSWLPEAGAVVACVRQGTHYGTVLYESGHLVEFGVFEVGELSSGRLGRYSVLFDRHGVTEELEQIAERSSAASRRLDSRSEFELLLFYLLTGGRRAARGEYLGAHKYIAYFAPDILLELLARRDGGDPPKRSDPLDPWRRFERVDPMLAAELLATLRLPSVEAARRLLEIAERELAAVVSDYPARAVAVIRRVLADLRGVSEGGARGSVR